MFYSVVINFKPPEDAVIPATRGYHAYALFLDLLRRTDPQAAQQLHDLQGSKPFTLSPLQGRFNHHPEGLAITAGQTYWIRLTVLREDLFARLLDALIRAGNSLVRLGQAMLQVNEIVTSPGKSPWSKCQDAASILARSVPHRQIELEFLSPTTFRSSGKRNVLFPDPRLLFQGYLAKWQEFSPPSASLDEGLAVLAEKGTRVSRYKLETRILHFGNYQEIGFEGRCTIEVAREIPEQVASQLNALADFAFYCGTGGKTTMGLGQTRRTEDGRAVSGRARINGPQG